jgi:hypothetical protein
MVVRTASCGRRDCQDGQVIVSVWVVEWYLDEDRRVLQVGDTISSWLTFEDAERLQLRPQERLHTIRGIARALPRWPGTEDGRHPVAIELDGGTLYWDAPERLEGTIEVTGTISLNNTDAPDGFPTTHGVVRRVRMEWQEFEFAQGGSRPGPKMGTHPFYEDVLASYLPTFDDSPTRSIADRDDGRDVSSLRWTGCLIDMDLTASAKR